MRCASASKYRSADRPAQISHDTVDGGEQRPQVPGLSFRCGKRGRAKRGSQGRCPVRGRLRLRCACLPSRPHGRPIADATTIHRKRHRPVEHWHFMRARQRDERPHGAPPRRDRGASVPTSDMGMAINAADVWPICVAHAIISSTILCARSKSPSGQKDQGQVGHYGNANILGETKDEIGVPFRTNKASARSS